jgi:hypothetical protein
MPPLVLIISPSVSMIFRQRSALDRAAQSWLNTS